MKNFIQKRYGFTMIEFIFVIIILGILTSTGMSRLDKNNYQDAADAILSDIRYTQHLALLDYKHNHADLRWQKSFWQIGFKFCSGSVNYYEYIGSDMNYGGEIDNNESAIDPLNGKRMIWRGYGVCDEGGDEEGAEDTSGRIFLTNKYGITNIAFSGSCSGSGVSFIAFDHLGRLYHKVYNNTIPFHANYLTSTCTITFTLSDDDKFAIDIEPETGYAHIVDQNNS